MHVRLILIVVIRIVVGPACPPSRRARSVLYNRYNRYLDVFGSYRRTDHIDAWPGHLETLKTGDGLLESSSDGRSRERAEGATAAPPADGRGMQRDRATVAPLEAAPGRDRPPARGPEHGPPRGAESDQPRGEGTASPFRATGFRPPAAACRNHSKVAPSEPQSRPRREPRREGGRAMTARGPHQGEGKGGRCPQDGLSAPNATGGSVEHHDARRGKNPSGSVRRMKQQRV